jgi:poly[(R)-3-hydroxyalkanoate] polymerase subunit PhaC
MAGTDDKRPADEGPASSPYVVRDAETFARNLARAVEEGGRALAAYLKPHEEGKPADLIAEAATEVVKTLGRIGEYWSADPARLMEAQTRLFASYFAIWQNAIGRAAGNGAAPAATPPSDRRFSDPDWNENPMFSALKQLYLATTNWAEELVNEAGGVDPETRQKAHFYLMQINNALSPTNFLLTNPEVLKITAETNAENLVKGMRMLADDVAAGKGLLLPRQSDVKAFKLGKNLATTPGKVVFQNALCQVIQYKQTTETVWKRPLLIVPPWINKFYVLDLTPEKSMIRWLVEQGHTVFVVSWVNPDARHAAMGFDQYMTDGILAALDAVEKATGAKKVNAVGYCVGGTLLAITLGYMAATGDDRIASATLLTAQIDFEFSGDLKVFADADQIAGVEAEMRKTGYLEGSKMATAFNLLRSNDLIWPYVVNDYLKGKEPLPFDLLYWNSDATRMPSANHSFYLRNCYLENNLSKGRMMVAGKKIDLSTVTVPVYNLATREDHIAPAKSVFIGCASLGGPVRFVLTGSGHIAGVVNPPARKKYQYWTGGAPVGSLDTWLKTAKEHPGSWWEDWKAWLESPDRRIKRRRRPGGGKLKPIEDAPGSYVMARAEGSGCAPAS